MKIYFCGTRSAPYGCFSNFSKHGFDLDGKHWTTSEHYYQAQKFANTEFYEKVWAAKTPKQAATFGRDRKLPLRSDWESVKEDAMRRALHAKFTYNAELKKILLSTNKDEIVEKTTLDYYWGCGKDGTGRNRLGMLLMELRDKLRRAAV
jgi:ribA/ribD-fused uncharacterized protein